jgi:hypoxanthine phosphoribosyltransferase
MSTDPGYRKPAAGVEFAHNSERQFALLLDFYDVEWQYEPDSFPIEFDDNGEPTKFFAPDFYLPEEDCYIEITTMNQKLVTRKNAKLRKLAEHHPEVECKILYLRDYLHLVLKYGLDDPEHLDEGAPPTRIPGEPRLVTLTDRGSAP